jgi:hypothetical protein
LKGKIGQKIDKLASGKESKNLTKSGSKENSKEAESPAEKT